MLAISHQTNGRMNQWRIGQDGKAHLIIGCDPGASAWVAVCEALITGSVRSKTEIRCSKCRKLRRK
jgi:hypothetical protein